MQSIVLKCMQDNNIVNDLIFPCSFLFSAGLLYEVNKLSGIMLSKSESKTKRHWVVIFSLGWSAFLKCYCFLFFQVQFSHSRKEKYQLDMYQIFVKHENLKDVIRSIALWESYLYRVLLLFLVIVPLHAHQSTHWD